MRNNRINHSKINHSDHSWSWKKTKWLAGKQTSHKTDLSVMRDKFCHCERCFASDWCIFCPALSESDSGETTVTTKLNMVYLSGPGKRRFANTVTRREREFVSIKWQRMMSRCWTKEKRIRYNVTRVIKRQLCWLAREERCSCALWTGCCLPPE